VADRDARCAEVARGPVGKVHRVAGPIIVLDPFPLVAHFDVGMPHYLPVCVSVAGHASAYDGDA